MVFLFDNQFAVLTKYRKKSSKAFKFSKSGTESYLVTTWPIRVINNLHFGGKWWNSRL